jgi:hypothetical protein
VVLTFQTNPGGLKLQTVAVGGGTTQATPFSKTVIVGSKNTLVAVTPQTLRKSTYRFVSWSDGGAATTTSSPQPPPPPTPPPTANADRAAETRIV